MIKSMTGFGQASGGRGSLRWSVDVRSWNHRFFDCSIRLPNLLIGIEDRIRELVHARVKRGKVAITIASKSKPSHTNGLVLDHDKIRFYVRSLKQLQKKYGLAKGPIDTTALLTIPNLFTVDQKDQGGEAYWSSVKGIVDQALKKLVVSKTTEGAALSRDLLKRVGVIESALKKTEAEAKQLPALKRERLKERIVELTGGVSVDAGRLEQEVAFFADRVDITEEVTRTHHHLDLFRTSLRASGEIGKKLDFISQEIHREVNTMSAKGQSSEISTQTIRIKSELDRIREQIQNIE